MASNSIKAILMKRDGISEQAAQDLIDEAREELFALIDDGESEAAYNICEEYFGLEPEYLIELM